ncbi:hypothetical protein HDZ31DRAFT_63939 [Schizophyllum fasciatum]
MFSISSIMFSSVLALAGRSAAHSFYGNAIPYGEGVKVTSCNCDNVPVGGAAFAASLTPMIGDDLCCKQVTVGTGATQVKTIFKDICDSGCDLHDVALETESWSSFTDAKKGPIPVFWTSEE